MEMQEVRFRNRVVALLIACIMTMISVIPICSVSAYDNSSRTYYVYDGSGKSLGSYRLNASDTISSSTSSISILGDDDRYRDYDQKGVVTISVAGGSGSGFVIGEHIIATAGHLAYSPEYGARGVSSISFYDETGQNCFTIKDAKEVHVPAEYVDRMSAGTDDPYNDQEAKLYDYALIYVEEDLSEYMCFNLGFMLDDFSGEITVTGYQGDKGEIESCVGNVTSVETLRCQYDADTSKGVSGGPVYVKTTSYDGTVSYTVVAINVSQSDSSNQGTRMTTTLLQFYQSNAYVGTYA